MSLRDQLMVVTSTLEFDPRSLEQEELDVSAVPGRRDHGRRRRHAGPRSNLERVLGGTRTRRLRPRTDGGRVADWRTDSVFVVTTRATRLRPRTRRRQEEGPDGRRVRSFVVWWS